MKPLSACRLYTLVDTACLRGRNPQTVAQQLCDGGSDLIQLRAKNSSPEEIRRMAEADEDGWQELTGGSRQEWLSGLQLAVNEFAT